MTEKVISFFEPGDIKRKRKDHEEYNWALLRMTDGEISPSDYYEKYRKLRKAMERLSFDKQKWINEATPLWCNGVIERECYYYYIYKNNIFYLLIKVVLLSTFTGPALVIIDVLFICGVIIVLFALIPLLLIILLLITKYCVYSSITFL